MAEQDGSFVEIIDTRLNLDPLQQDLQRFVEMYQSALSKAGEGAPGLFNVQIFDSFKSELDSLKGDLRDFASVFTDTLNAAASAVAKGAEQSAQRAVRTIKAVKEEADKTLPSVEERTQNMIEAISNRDASQPNVKGNAFNEHDIYKHVQDLMLQNPGTHIGDYLTNENQAWFVNYEALMAKAEDRMRAYEEKKVQAEQEANAKIISLQEELVSLFGKEWDKATAERAKKEETFLAEEKKYQQAIVDARAKQNAASNAQEIRDVEAAREKELALLRESIQQRYSVEREGYVQRAELLKQYVVQSEQAAQEAAHAAHGKDMPDNAREAAESARLYASEVAEAYRTAAKAAGELDAQTLAAAESAAKFSAEMARAQAAVAQTAQGDVVGRFVRGVTHDMRDLFANVVRFQLAWTAVGKAVDLVGAAIMSPIKALEQGIEYLNEIQDKTDQLAGVFNASARWSNDMAVNLQKSEEAAKAVVEQLKQVSASYGLNFNSLFNSLKSLVANGAGNLTDGSMKQMVDLATQFAALVKAARGDVNTQRVILSQIPNLLTGQVTGVNQLLQMLGLTNDKWNAIVQHAKEHHDLLEQLQPYMAPFIAQLGKAEDHQERLKESVSLMIHEVEAHFAKGLWEQWTKLLQLASEFLSKNRDELNALATLLGHNVENAISLVKAITGMDDASQHLQSTWGSVAKVIADIGGMFGFMERAITTLIHLAGDLASVFNVKNGGPTGALEDMKKHLQQFAEQDAKARGELLDFQDMIDHTGKYDPEYQKQLHANENKPKVEDPMFWLRQPAVKNNHIAQEELANARATLQQQLQGADAVRRKKEDDANYDFAQKRINEDTLHKRIMEALKAEEEEVGVIISKYDSLVRRLPGTIDQIKKNTAITQATTEGSRIETGLSTDEARANDALAKANVEKRQDQLREDLRMFRQISEQKIAQAKAEGRSLAEVAFMEAQARKEANQMQQQALREEISMMAAGLRERMQLEAQLHSVQEAGNAQVSVDHGKITDATFEDQLRKKKQEYEESIGPLKERLDHLQDITGTGALPQQKQALADLAAEYMSVTKAQEVYLEGLLNAAKIGGASVQEIDKLNAALVRQQQIVRGATNVATKDQRAASTGKYGDLANLLFGGNVVDFSQFGRLPGSNGEPNGPMDFATSVKQLQNAFQNFSQSAKTIAVAFSGHNVIGGVGASLSAAGNISTAASNLSQLQDTKLGSVLGNFGAIGSLAGGVMSLFSDIFTAEARHIANDIKKAFQETVLAYQNGAATLTATMQSVEQQRSEAIARLSGKKGGQDQLDQLLPQLDQEIASLQNQQAQIKETFMNSLSQLRLNAGLSSDPLSQMLQTWQQINDQVQQYISAGGDAKLAQEALSLTLKQISSDAWQNLNQGETQAIQDALNLNQLLQQRINLENEYTQQVNNLLNQDSVQRRASMGVTVGMQIQNLQANYNLQLEQLNAQISLDQQRVDLYRQVYDIQTSTVALENQSNAANIAALQKQIQMLKDYAAIYNNIGLGSNGQYQMNPNFASSIGAVNININGSALTQQQMTDAITQALQNSARYGNGSQFNQFFNG